MAAELIVAGMMLAMAGLLVWALGSGWPSNQRRFGIASLTAWHAWQPADKQKATAFVIEGRAGKRVGSGEEERTEEP